MHKFFKILILILFNLTYLFTDEVSSEEKIKVGLLVPLSGINKEIGQQIIKSTRIALNDINSDSLEIYPKDTNSDPNKTLQSANELKQMGVQIVIGPVFHKSLQYLDEVEDVIFVSFTNKTLDLSNNIISSCINANSQLNTIKKFIA